MTREEEIQVRKWWLDQLKEITRKVMDAEDRRVERERVKAQKQLGEYQTENDIQEAYAYGMITDAKRDKLLDLLEKADFNPAEDRMYRLKIDFLQEDFQNQKEIIERLSTEGMEAWA